MATLPRATITRDNLVFIGWFLPALEKRFDVHARSSFAALVLLRTRKPTRLIVGRLHYSLGFTLSAHFR
jgi:hypothetical protein